MRRKRWTPDADDRLRLTEHLFYEVQMTFFLAAELDKPTGPRLDVSLRNAQVEALALHVRQLTEFFWGERDRDDRFAYAADYYPAGDWERLRPPLPAILVPDGAAFARLGYEQSWVRAADKVWDLVSQAFALASVVMRFADTVDHEQLEPGYASGLRICAETFVAGQRPPAAQRAA